MTASPAREGLAVETGEVVALPVKFEMNEYLQQLNSTGAIERQQKLAQAYDAACRALIGPNDIQREGKREFKKKSAWRKLARHFGLSIEADPDDAKFTRFEIGGWLATARAIAVAPWGQRFTDVGACGSDEETGRKTITMADAIATAMTRAINRAISNLIAMGEVSAEEVGARAGERADDYEPAPNPEPTSDTPWPGNDSLRGKKLIEWSKTALQWLIEPGRNAGPHTETWQQLAKDELKRREQTPAGTAR